MEIKTEFIDGKMIITHPSGIVQKISKAGLGKFRDKFIRQKENIDRQIKLLDGDISKL